MTVFPGFQIKALNSYKYPTAKSRYLPEKNTYPEGLKDGKTFSEAAAYISCKKPIIVLKGGQTEGSRSVILIRIENSLSSWLN